MAGARSPSVKKRPLAGSSSYRPVRGPGGSSFLKCPGCGRSMHAATLSFHKQACPLFAEYEVGLAAHSPADVREAGTESEREQPAEGLEGTHNAEKSEHTEGADTMLNEGARSLEQTLQEPSLAQEEAVDKEKLHTGELEEEEFERAKDAGSELQIKNGVHAQKEDWQARESEDGAKDLASELQARDKAHAAERDEWEMQMAERESEMTGLAGNLMQAREGLAAARKEIEQLKLALLEKEMELSELRAFKKKTEAQIREGPIAGLSLPPAEQHKVESRQVASPKAAAPVTPEKDFGVSTRMLGKVLDAPIFSTPPGSNADIGANDKERNARKDAAEEPADVAEGETRHGQKGDGQEGDTPEDELGVKTALKDRPSFPASPEHTQRDTQEDSEQVEITEAWDRVGALLQEAARGSEGLKELAGADRNEEADIKEEGSREKVNGDQQDSLMKEQADVSAQEDEYETERVPRKRKRGRGGLEDDASSDGVVRRLFDAEDESDDDESLQERLARKQRVQELVVEEAQRQLGRLRKVGSTNGEESPKRTRRKPMLTRAKRNQTEAQRGEKVTGLDSEGGSDEIEESSGSELQEKDEISDEGNLKGFVVEDGDGSQEPETNPDTEEAEFESAEAEPEEGGADSDTANDESPRGGGSILELYGLNLQKPKPSEWQYETDLTAALGKDDLLCMKAVCALYRRQTLDERVWQAARHRNYEGFSQTDAERGSKIAVFLTDDNPTGPLVKSVEDLEKFDHRAPEACQRLALKYSGQLWEMVKAQKDPAAAAKRDPYFP